MTAWPGERDLQALRILRTQMLWAADQGQPLAEFLSSATHMLHEVAGGATIAVRIEEWVPNVRCRAIRSDAQSFRFETERYDPAAPGYPRASPRNRLCRALEEGGAVTPHVTPRGSLWTTEARCCSRVERARAGKSTIDCWAIAEDIHALVLIPFEISGRPLGVLQLADRAPERFTEPIVLFFEEVADLLGLALTHHRANWALQERVKELTCLFETARIMGEPELTLPAMLQRIVHVLPPAWQYPERCVARIVLDDAVYETGEDEPTGSSQSAQILVNGQARGRLEVGYASARADAGEIPFLQEEQELIHEIARQVGILIEARGRSDERRLLEEQLRHADRLTTLGKLTAGVAHELNGPIGSVLGFAELVSESPGLSEQAMHDLERIRQAALLAREIIRQLMFFGRQMPPGRAPVSLNAVVGDALALLQPRLAPESIELTCDLAPGLPTVLAEHGQLQQVVVNLIINAVQAMPHGGRLCVTTAADGDRVRIVVEDSGVGMTPEVMRQIFEPFYTTKDVGQGTGLGLSVVHGIITAHGGSVSVESKPGRGARFTVQLPAEAAPA
jgi:two-component system, NtrC family, sensor kinase